MADDPVTEGNKSPCRVADIPIRPCTTILDAWDASCACGWGAICDSPEAAAIGLAWHLSGELRNAPGPREWTRTADDTHVDWPALQAHCEWLSQADMTDDEEEYGRHLDAFYTVVTPDLILDLIEGRVGPDFDRR